ncbi:uncharacterized protein BO96DRAFT_345396 [Aspergillus niger CBS 101883]|uniref:Uncharacterized protein n=2 Tax=Aspergillus niger TaxID=5061 RepID=A2QP82_ASPNC|nr:uncharacterized protein BO96DRAFT_345396 [Aspergillus niger CBS 101883]XP_059601053.1 hypothetical protein An07g08533 [Aspergillus niger]PYH53419.1 hypothetical protein BO96DRAFT_345396 [Aspergillus niger CBS 101883]CAK39647.1 hypothetical protein An07g08533 [Aspergillus niger]
MKLKQNHTLTFQPRYAIPNTTIHTGKASWVTIQQLSLVYEAEKTVDCTITVDHFFSQLHQLSSRAVSVSSRFDVLPFRRLLTQTANSSLSDYRCPIRDIDG